MAPRFDNRSARCKTESNASERTRRDTMKHLNDALNEWADQMSGLDDGSVWQAMTCSEAEATIQLLVAMGRSGAAEMIHAIHAQGDEPGDMHHEGQPEWEHLPGRDLNTWQMQCVECGAHIETSRDMDEPCPSGPGHPDN